MKETSSNYPRKKTFFNGGKDELGMGGRIGRKKRKERLLKATESKIVKCQALKRTFFIEYVQSTHI